ncbi:hypothetical protein AB6A40_008200 [Gnathostoma spinigerum]|uniref:Uncharacterized protein n=1 Tax=Gnathostoma spinigerum TaxID=75299 RepID=A0ABD6EVJ3_9BILA
MWRFVSPLLLFVASLVCGDDNLQRRAEVRKLCLESLYGLETHQKEGKIDTLLEMRKVMSNGSMTTRIFQNLLSDETRGQDTFNLHGIFQLLHFTPHTKFHLILMGNRWIPLY